MNTFPSTSSIAANVQAFTPSIVCIETESDGKHHIGSGVVIGRTSSTNRAVIATVGHVLEPASRGIADGLNYCVKISRFDTNNTAVSICRISAANLNTKKGGTITTCSIKGIDLGVVIAPVHSEDNELFYPDSEIAPLPIRTKVRPFPGTNLAWSGFPALLTYPEFHRSPLLCYYQGVVASTYEINNCPIIIIDGHALPGVSGGPIWQVNESTQQLEIIGLVSTYASYEMPQHWNNALLQDPRVNKRDRLPGFVLGQPIIPLIEFVRSWNTADTYL